MLPGIEGGEGGKGGCCRGLLGWALGVPRPRVAREARAVRTAAAGASGDGPKCLRGRGGFAPDPSPAYLGVPRPKGGGSKGKGGSGSRSRGTRVQVKAL